MKIWKLICDIESENEFDAEDLLSRIDQEVNRGDGFYVDTTSKKTELILVEENEKEF